MAADFEFSGLDGVLANMQAWGDRVIAAADDAIVEAAAEGADLVQANAPVLTGRLRASVTHDHLKWGLAVVTVGEDVPYVKPQEVRTRFFRDSITVIQSGLLERVHRKMREAF